jgi:GNAT superfamily N-acetyltransferase
MEIRKGLNAFKNPRTKLAAKKLVSYYEPAPVSPSYFDHLWKYRNRNGNYTAWKNGDFSGFAFVKKTPREWKIDLIGAEKGQGIGTLLLNQIKRNALNARVQFLNLNSVSIAVGFYKKQGFTKRKGTRMHYSVQRPKTHSMSLRPRRHFSVKLPRFTYKKKSFSHV